MSNNSNISYSIANVKHGHILTLKFGAHIVYNIAFYVDNQDDVMRMVNYVDKTGKIVGTSGGSDGTADYKTKPYLCFTERDLNQVDIDCFAKMALAPSERRDFEICGLKYVHTSDSYALSMGCKDEHLTISYPAGPDNVQVWQNLSSDIRLIAIALYGEDCMNCAPNVYPAGVYKCGDASWLDEAEHAKWPTVLCEDVDDSDSEDDVAFESQTLDELAQTHEELSRKFDESVQAYDVCAAADQC